MIVEERVPMRHYENVRTGAEVVLGKTGAGFYVEARHPDFQLPFRKTYEWHQYALASRDFDLLSAVTGAVREERTQEQSEALAG
jgi:hypothetical protein